MYMSWKYVNYANVFKFMSLLNVFNVSLFFYSYAYDIDE